MNKMSKKVIEVYKDESLDSAIDTCIKTFELALKLKDLEIDHLKKVIEIYKKEELWRVKTMKS